MTRKSSSQNPDGYKVTVGNALIEANYPEKLTARAHKVARLLMSQVKPDDTNLGLYRMDIDWIKSYLGYHDGKKWGRFLTDLEDIARRLNHNPLHIQINKQKYTKAFFISSYTIDLAERTVEFEISQKLKPYLIELRSEFTSYLLSNIPRLKSGYSIRMYELLSQYRRIGKRTFEVEDLKLKMGCDYPLYGHFKSKALKKSSEDLIKHTDLRFEMEEHKVGRKVESLTFHIFPNVPKEPAEISDQLNLLELSPLKDELPLIVVQLIDMGIPSDTARRFFQKGFRLIEDPEKRAIAQERVGSVSLYFEEKFLLMNKKRKTITSPTGFLIRALQEDWTDKGTTMQLKHKVVAQKEQEQDRKNQEAAMARKEICQGIVQEQPEILQGVLESALNEMGNLGGQFAKGKSPEALFEEGGFVATFMESEIERRYPDRFRMVSTQNSEGDN